MRVKQIEWEKEGKNEQRREKEKTLIRLFIHLFINSANICEGALMYQALFLAFGELITIW